MTGSGEAIISEIVSRMASISPPGVFNRTMTAPAPSCLAWASAPPTISAVTGWIIPSTSTAIILPGLGERAAHDFGRNRVDHPIDIDCDHLRIRTRHRRGQTQRDREEKPGFHG